MKNKAFYIDVKIKADINELQTKVNQAAQSVNKLGSTPGGSQVQNHFDQLTKSVENLQKRASQPIYSQSEFNKLTKDLAEAKSAYDSLNVTVNKLRNASDAKKLELIPASEQAKIRKAEGALEDYRKAVSKTSETVKELKKERDRLAQQEGIKKTADDDVAKYSKELEKAQERIKQLRKEQEKLSGESEAIKSDQASLRGKKASATKKGDEAEAARLTQELEKAAQKATQVKTRLGELKPQIENATRAEEKLNKQLKDAQTKANTAASSIIQIKNNISTLDAGKTKELNEAFTTLKQKAEELGVKVNDLKDASSIDTLIQRMQQLKGKGLDQANKAIEKTALELNGMKSAMDKAGNGIDKAREKLDKFNKQLQNVEGMKSRISYFFSLANSVQILRRAFQDAVQSIKDLDSVMTEAAVVTDFSIEDMWGRMPEYTQKATELGVATKELYAATTLYYQQGLKTNAAMGVGVETMKMAKIAGLEAGDATQYMTAALRGFNMEISEASATRVNDVYSKLAAITASDTAQIATAMSKTASIASAANMEFENTAALLAQIIETTQEAPETAGTALKTIIARFSEVKQLQSQGKKTGQDEEGEVVDVNKIDRALKSVGISMNGFFAGTEGLDSVLMKLAEKWDTLDFTTQRYIATMAAGSRQQSRFIAMMSDYARTQELVTEASNSAGASNDQFDKTLDSLGSKLNQLHNAWEAFTMSIADSTFIKEGVEVLTAFVTALNDALNWLTSGLAEVDKAGNRIETTFSRAFKSIAGLAVLFGGLKVGQILTESVFAKMSLNIENRKKKLSGDTGKTTDSTKTDATKAGTDIRQGGVDAKRELTTGAREAGEILKSAASEAAAKETTTTDMNETKKARSTEANILKEESSTNSKVVKEQESANLRAVKETTTTAQTNALALQGQSEVNALRMAGTQAETSLEVIGAETETSLEIVGAEAETGVEVTGAQAEMGTEIAGQEAIELMQFEAAMKEYLMMQYGMDESMAKMLSAYTVMELKLRALATELSAEGIKTSLIKREIELGRLPGGGGQLLLGAGANPLLLGAGAQPAGLLGAGAQPAGLLGAGTTGGALALRQGGALVSVQGAGAAPVGATQAMTKAATKMNTAANTMTGAAGTMNGATGTLSTVAKKGFIPAGYLGAGPAPAGYLGPGTASAGAGRVITGRRGTLVSGNPYGGGGVMGWRADSQDILSPTGPVYTPESPIVRPKGGAIAIRQNGAMVPYQAPGPLTTTAGPVPTTGYNYPVVSQSGAMVPYQGGGAMVPYQEPPSSPKKAPNPTPKQKTESGKGGVGMFGWLIAIAAALIAVLAIADAYDKYLDKTYETSKERLNALKSNEKQLAETASQINKDLSSFQTNKQQMKDQIKDLDKLSKGSSEWAAAIHEVRSEMQGILDKYPELREYTTFQNGVRTLTEEGWREYEKSLMREQAQTTQALYTTKMAIQSEQDYYDAEHLEGLKTSSVDEDEKEKMKMWTKVGTVGLGVGLGALGSLLGPIGTVLGAALGAAIGGVLGGGLTKLILGAERGADPNLVNEIALAASSYTLERDGAAEEVTFSAMEATDEEIDEFLTTMGTTGEDFDTLSEYIKENRAAFDEHTAAIKQSAAAFYDYAVTLGQARAQELGYTGETAEVYGNVTGAASQAQFDKMRQAATLEANAAGFNVNDKENKKMIAKATGYVYDEVADVFKSGETIIDSEFDEIERKQAWITARAVEMLNNMSDSSFNLLTTAGLDMADTIAKLQSGQQEIQGTVSLADYQEYFQDGVELYKKTIEDMQPKIDTVEEKVEIAKQWIKDSDKNYGDVGLKATTDMSYYEDTIKVTLSETIDVFESGLLKTLEGNSERADEIAKAFEEQFRKEAKAEMGAFLYLGSSAVYERVDDPMAITWEIDDKLFYNALAQELGIPSGFLLQELENNEDLLKQQMGGGFMTNKISDLHWNGMTNLSREEYLTYASDVAQGGMEFLRYAGVNEAIEFSQMVQAIKTHKDLGKYEQDGRLETVINGLMSSLTGPLEKYRSLLASQLSSVEFTKLDSLNNVSAFLDSLLKNEAVWSNVTEEDQKKLQEGLKDSTAAWKDLVEYLDKTGVAIASIDIEGLVEQLNKTQEVLKKIRDLEIGEAAIFTDEEYKTLLNGGVDKEDLVATVDGFVYIGDRIEDLDNTLKRTNEILLGQQAAALRRSIQAGQFVASDSDSSLSAYSYQTVNTWSGEQIAKYMDDAVKTAVDLYNSKNPDNQIYGDAYGNYTDDQIKKAFQGTPLEEQVNVESLARFLEKGMVNGEDGYLNASEDWTNYSDAFRLVFTDLITYLGTSYDNLTTNNEEYLSQLEQIKMQELSLMSGSEMLGSIGAQAKGLGNEGGIYTAEDVGRALDAQIERLGLAVSTSYTESGVGVPMLNENYLAQKAQEAYDAAYAAAFAREREAGSDQAQATEYATEQARIAQEQKRNELIERASLLSKALTLDAYNNAKQVENMANKLGGLNKVLVEGNRKLPEYREALGKVKETLEDIYKIKIDPKFMTQHQGLIERMLTGDQEAWDDFSRELLNNQMGELFDKTAKEFDQWGKQLPIPEVGISVQYDDTNLMAAMWGLQKFGEQAMITKEYADKIAAAYDVIGVSVTWNVNWDDTPMWQMPDGSWLASQERPVGALNSSPAYALNGLGMTNNGNKNPFGGNKSRSKKWENSIEKFYNTYERINVLLREREQLERRYDKLLKSREVNGKKLIENSQRQLDLLKEEKAQQEFIQQGKLLQIQALMDKNKKKWGSYVTGFDPTTGQISIDWFKVNKLKNSKKGEQLEAYIKELEGYRDQYTESQDALNEINDKMSEILEQGRDEYLDLEERIKEALVGERQREIDKLSEINESINDVNSSIINSMQEQIEEYRQNRDNQKTEEEIAYKQRRLAYLQQDTSGANAMEILNLQKEIEDAQESYTDTLIDQRIADLEKQNDEAAEQRERQIQIMEAQLEHDQMVGAFWEQVHNLMSETFNEDGTINLDSSLITLLQDIEEFMGMSGMAQDQWTQEMLSAFSQSQLFLAMNRARESDTTTFTTADGKTVTGIAGADGSIMTNEGKIYHGVHQDMDGKWVTEEDYQDPKEKTEKTKWSSSYPKPSSLKTPMSIKTKNAINDVKGLQTALAILGLYTGSITGTYDPATVTAVSAFQNRARLSEWGKAYYSKDPDGVFDKETQKAMAAFPEYEFKTGGLADFTGPAWLDGTRSKPEYVLNADQTKAFFNLVDVLGSLRNTQANSAQNNGENNYDIDINVESIGSDYDVEQLANKVKSLINEDARYRNNNAINLMR